MKTCKGCEAERPLTCFYKHKRMADGHLNFCKDCVKARVADHRTNNLEAIQAYDRKRGRLEHRKQAVRQRRHRYTEKRKVWTKRWRHLNPHKRAAHVRLGNMVREGIVRRKPCEVCGSWPTHAHHDDYTKPFDVRWLCPEHHGAEHAQDTTETHHAR